MKITLQRIQAWFSEAKEKYPFLLFFLLAVVVYWPLSFGGYALQFDAVDVMMPWRFYGSEALREGMVPLWNPYQDGGYPFYADHQYSIWNPELFIVSLFTRYNATVIQWLFLIYISLGALGFRFLLKQLKLPRPVWFLGGAMFLLSGILIGHSQSLISILGAVWLPWALGMYIRALENNFRLKDTIGLVVSMFLMLAAGYQAVSIMLFYVVLALGITHLIFLWRQKDWLNLRRFLLGHILAGLLLGILLAGIVFSMAEVFPHLSRLAGITLEESQLIHLHPKSFGSLLYPLASVQEEYRGTAVSAQNIFSGILFFFALFYGLRNLKPYLSRPMIVLLVFGLIYGLAALGPNTPVQPFFYHYVPGCNQFYYAVFYRYFAWFVLLALACIGVHHAIQKENHKPLLWFLLAASIFYGISAVWSWESLDTVKQALAENWALTLRRLKWTPALLLDSLAHLMVLGSFVMLLIWRKSIRLLPFFIIAELALIAQLNLPVTTYGEIRSATLDNYLETKKQGFPKPNNHLTIADNNRTGYYASLWRNLGNYTNVHYSTGYTSFRLRGREKVWKEQGEMENFLPSKPLAYLENDSVYLKIVRFEPGKMVLKIPEQDGGKLVVQQANFPGWKARVDGKEAKITTVNEFQISVQLKPGRHTVELEFVNPLISALFYLTNYGFLALLFLYWGLVFEMGSTVQRFLGLGLLFGVITLRQLSFEKSPAQILKVSNEDEFIKFSGQMVPAQYSAIWQWISDKEEIQVDDLRDDDPVVMSMFHHRFDKRQEEKETVRFSGIAAVDTLRKEIPAGGFYDIDVPENYREGWLLYSMDVHESVNELKDVLVVMELKEDERIIYAQSVPLLTILRNGAQAAYANGYLIPDLCGKRYLKMYLWNNSSASFTFSNFKLGLTP